MAIGRVFDLIRHIGKLLCLCAVMLLSGCLESDEPVAIQPADIAQIEGLAGVWNSNESKQEFEQLVLLENRHYAYNGIKPKDGRFETSSLYDVVFVPLSISEPGMEAFLGIVQHLGKKETGKVEYTYVELRRMRGQFSWRIPKLSDDKALQEAATVAASKKGIRLVERPSIFVGNATKLTGELNSTFLVALFSDLTFRKSLNGDYVALKPISDADKQVLAAAGVDLKSGAAAQPTVAASTPADLVAQLQKRITPDGPFDQVLFDRTASAVRASDPQSPATQELLANARDFIDGKVRPSMFVAYLKETLSSITAANTGARASLKLLQEKSAGGDLWAKFFLARAHFHAAANAKEAQLRERFAGKGFPDTVRPYWDAYQTALRDPSFDGKFETAVTLAEEGAQKNFAPSVNVLGVMRLNGLGLLKDESHGLQLIRQAADAGFSMAMLGLANAYANGQGIPKDLTQAHSWWRKASDLGQADAMYALAFSFADGRGVPKNQAEAVGWLRKAAELGNPASMSSLGDFYAAGHGVAKDELVATQWYRKAAEAGEADAMAHLGWRYENGRGVAKDEAQAVQWYRKAAEGGNGTAMLNLGHMYSSGRGVTKDKAQAVQWNRKAAELGHAGAMVRLGDLYAAGQGVPKDEAQAVQWYRKAADAGNATAMFNLGHMYSSGRGVTKDEAQAVQWYHKAAEAGEADAMAHLGWRYDNGHGVPKDEAQAVQWYRKASELGNADAMFMLGLDYVIGDAVPKDDAQAFQWVRKAAQLGNNLAMDYLGTMYEKGLGVAKDVSQALEWHQKAAALGNEQAAQSVQRLRDGTAQGSSSMSAKEWDFKYRNAKPISPAEILSTLPPVRLEFVPNNGPLQYVSFASLQKVVSDVAQNEGIKIVESSPIVLRVEFSYRSTVITHTEGNLNDKHPVETYFATVQIIVPASVYRNGNFYYRSVMPISFSDWGLSYGSNPDQKGTIDIVQGILKSLFLSIKSDKTVPENHRAERSIWNVEESGLMHEKYLRSRSDAGEHLRRSFTGIDGIQVRGTVNGEAGQFINPETVNQGWMSRLTVAGILPLQKAGAELVSEISVLKQDINRYQVMPLLGAFAPSINFGMVRSRTSVMERNLVLEFNGEFVRTDVVMYDDVQISGSLWRNAKQEVLGLLDSSMKDLLREARSNR